MLMACAFPRSSVELNQATCHIFVWEIRLSPSHNISDKLQYLVFVSVSLVYGHAAGWA